MRTITTLFLLALVGAVSASQERRGPPPPPPAQAEGQNAEGQNAGGQNAGDTSVSLVTESSAFEGVAIAPNPSAPPPSAQCRYGWSVTGAVVEFGMGVTGSDWDEICGLWLAAQQTTGEAKSEAASAAFCLTMKKAKVASPTCASWDKGQGELRVEMNQNQAAVVFGGAGTSAVVVRTPDN
jgi:hypothetical protein